MMKTVCIFYIYVCAYSWFFNNNQHNMLHGIKNIKITWCYSGAQIRPTGDVREVGRK